MNAVQIHLALNHAPLFLSLIGSVLLILGMIWKKDAYKKLSLYILTTAAIFIIPVYFSGEGTEEIVEELAGINKGAIEKHEEMAKITLIIIGIMGIISFTGLFFQKNTHISKIIGVIALILSLASFGTMAQTAHLGGLIRHSELQNGTTSENNTDQTDKGDNEKEDD